MSDNPIARLDEDNVKIEPPVEETIPQTEPQLQNTDVGPSHQDRASAATSAVEQQQPEPPEPSQVSTSNRKQSDRFGEPIPTNLLEKGGRLCSFQRNIKNFRSLLIVSKNERKTYLTNFVVMSISNGHKTKLNSNSVLALSLFY